MHPIRKAIIPTRVKYNTTGSAADVRWGWKTVNREVLQYRDDQGNWHDVPTEQLPLDDSAERAEAESAERARKQERAAERALVSSLREGVAQGVLWVSPRGNHYGHFLDSHRAIFGWSPEEDGYTYYTDKKGVRIARSNAAGQQVLASAYADWLDPDTAAAQMLADLRARLGG